MYAVWTAYKGRQEGNQKTRDVLLVWEGDPFFMQGQT